ncbi:conserved hypothetical protein [Candidatus Brocadia pituitae]|nr:conserved hypothetical protein [Candidatus Brocadia pituitae]
MGVAVLHKSAVPNPGKIVYDGMLEAYNIFIGVGIRSGLNEEYMAAKQNNRIVTTLEPETAPQIQVRHQQKPDKDWKPVVEELVRASENLRRGSPVQNAAFALLRDSARVVQSAVQQTDNLEEIWRSKQQVQKALKRLQTVLDRAEQ